MHDDGGKHIHWAEPVEICCKHGHDVVEQLVVKQLPTIWFSNNKTKFDFLFYLRHNPKDWMSFVLQYEKYDIVEWK